MADESASRSVPPDAREDDRVEDVRDREPFTEDDIRVVHALAENSLGVFIERLTSGPFSRSKKEILASWSESVSSLRPPPLFYAAYDETVKTATQVVSSSHGNLDLLGNLTLMAKMTYGQLTVLQRVREGGHLLLGVFAWFAYLAWTRPALNRLFASIIAPAYAQADQPPISWRLAIISIFAVAITIVLVMSAYAALLRKPPLESAREFLKLTLAFASGVVGAGLTPH
jgi:hypothetical protein